ncbi:nuclear pore complex protein Nup155-like, partial [Limulus polyphemus]|uniref:Nuclear pore complex protein Nup155-like n=1 Tax=Limulus polyphemus TaxID=6850 RepID=A0ABM1C0V5_LIMPO
VNLGQNVSQVLNFLRPETLTPGEMTQMQQQLSRKSQAEAQLQERSSLLNLQQLLNYTCEVLGLWKVLCDHQFHIITGMLSKDLQNQMKVLTCRDFICNGREVAGALVTALINRYLDDNATTDAISGRLREVCPSIFKVEDAVFSKAHEMLVNARNIQSKQEKEKVLREALQLCMQVSPQLSLQSVCSLFQQARYYRGILDISLSAAQRRDPQGLAIHFYKNGEPPEDQQGLQYYSNRMECYRTVMENLSHLLTVSTSLPQSPSIPRVPGPPPTRDPNLLSQEEARVYFEQMFQLALKSDDELFHVALYDWLTEQHQTERLLDIKSPFLENYLKQCTTAQPDNLASVELMWKFYEKNQNYSAAARILAKLADRHGTDINLQQRLEYLSRAVICVKSSELRITTAGEGEFLHDLEEKMEVARIQLQVLEALMKKSIQLPVIQDAISRLNSDVLDITQLYEDFAEVYDLPECKLSIVHCAGHYDPTLIESLWQNIIDKGKIVEHNI